MKTNLSLVERIKLQLFEPKARIEIIDYSDSDAKKGLKEFAFYVAESLSKKHSNLKILNVYRTNNLWNFEKHFLFGGVYGYVISVPLFSNLTPIKLSCIDLEFKEEKRICDIDVYLNRKKKISRVDLGYPKVRPSCLQEVF